MSNMNEYDAQKQNQPNSSVAQNSATVLEEIFRNAELCTTSLKKIAQKCKDQDLVCCATGRYDQFVSILTRTKKRLKDMGRQPEGNSTMKTAMMKTSIAMTAMVDSSAPKFADMLAQGYNMGIIDLNKLSNAYKDTMDDETAALLTELINLEQRCLDDVKKFL